MILFKNKNQYCSAHNIKEIKILNSLGYNPIEYESINLQDYFSKISHFNIIYGFDRERNWTDYPKMEINKFIKIIKSFEFVISDDQNEFWTYDMLLSYIIDNAKNNMIMVREIYESKEVKK